MLAFEGSKKNTYSTTTYSTTTYTTTTYSTTTYSTTTYNAHQLQILDHHSMPSLNGVKQNASVEILIHSSKTMKLETASNNLYKGGKKSR